MWNIDVYVIRTLLFDSILDGAVIRGIGYASRNFSKPDA